MVLHDYSLGISSNFHVPLWKADTVGDAVGSGKEEVEVELEVMLRPAVRESTGVAEEEATSIVEEANGIIVEEEDESLHLLQIFDE